MNGTRPQHSTQNAYYVDISRGTENWIKARVRQKTNICIHASICHKYLRFTIRSWVELASKSILKIIHNISKAKQNIYNQGYFGPWEYGRCRCSWSVFTLNEYQERRWIAVICLRFTACLLMYVVLIFKNSATSTMIKGISFLLGTTW